jgi:hypothetical protein
MEEALVPDPNFNRPVKDLVYKDLLTNTFTQANHDRGIRTWCVSASYPQCVFCGNKFRCEVFNVECHMDPKIGKTTIGKERTILLNLYREREKERKREKTERKQSFLFFSQKKQLPNDLSPGFQGWGDLSPWCQGSHLSPSHS